MKPQHPFERMEKAALDALDLRHHARPFPADFSGFPVKSEPKLHTPTLDLANYVEVPVDLPAAVDRSNIGNALLANPLGNDYWGDCGDAMTVHGFGAYHLDAGTPVPPFDKQDALNLYSDVSGFRESAGPPGKNPTDVGTDNEKLAAYVTKHGLVCAADGSVHKWAGTLGLDPTNDYLSRLAIWEFVVLFRSVALPISAQTQSTWAVVGDGKTGNSKPGGWGYHDIPYLSYDPLRYRNDSWGIEMLVDVSFDNAYAVGGFVGITQEMTNLQGVSPAGVNWTKLNADLAATPSTPIE
jgi:hypothetical protein